MNIASKLAIATLATNVRMGEGLSGRLPQTNTAASSVFLSLQASSSAPQEPPPCLKVAPDLSELAKE